MPLAFRLAERYNIDICATDYYHVYNKFHIAKRHVMTKKETALVENKNFLFRHYLARFNRKTKRYSKAMDMMVNSTLMLFNKNFYSL